MIVIDIETSGVDMEHCGIWQIGAIDTQHPEHTFLDECRIEDTDVCESGALAIIGKTESYLRDKTKQSQRELLLKFFLWCARCDNKIMVCQHPQFDHSFIHIRAGRYHLHSPIGYHAFDLHSIASLKYYQINHQFLVDKGWSRMGLKAILEFCGMQDNRGHHNALEDAKLTAECFIRIVEGKGLLGEFDGFAIPEYLKNDSK